MKINQLLADWPSGSVATQAWLHEHGVGPGLVRKYQLSGWVERVGHGAWKRKGDEIDWQGGVFALQQGTSVEVWPGGATALSLVGYSHYLTFGKPTVDLFGTPAAVLPGWFRKYPWNVNVSFNPGGLFAAMEDLALQVFQVPRSRFELKISTPERAILELIHQSANEVLFSSVVDVFAGLGALSPRRLQRLLESCNSVRVKRVFLLLARNSSHAWYRRIDLSSIDLGKGKRQIIRGGRLDKEFLITVPESFISGA
ncbi:type IV toxin-antitoxin system AbiEi family antitoxin domain-containing protein [Pseudomonas sp. FP453]|uniref:type IV toxin-antitoxin system AbiEi family antitoxin n=1 Tax=unclassified Pseudomonas TaxID=196821 RepID=UPI0003700B77|nr:MULTISPECIES: type IV toxin-antitoxin system AbiEi family antitoxin [unclassified Pseudomonas]WLH89808.1 type IV toxin-antitoxin system AbiEi family antitoxin domain-containing protein [Pseudomonas sp. FP453]